MSAVNNNNKTDVNKYNSVFSIIIQVHFFITNQNSYCCSCGVLPFYMFNRKIFMNSFIPSKLNWNEKYIGGTKSILNILKNRKLY
jgi:hypothetical protein